MLLYRQRPGSITTCYRGATDPNEQVYARFRVSVDNGFRNEFSYIDYRKWGVVELWAAGRITGPQPLRQAPGDGIEVWFNWELVGFYRSYQEAQARVDALLALAPVRLDELASYMRLDVR